jgi:hypothetical protein
MSFHGVVIYDNTLYVRFVYIHNEIAFKGKKKVVPSIRSSSRGLNVING